MAAEEPFGANPPPDEVWWTRELHRNEKLLDKYMAVLGDNPDWEKLPSLGDMEGPRDTNDGLATFETNLDDDPFGPGKDDEIPNVENSNDLSKVAENDDAEEPDPDEDPEVNVNYPMISQLARQFACDVFDLENPPGNAELLFLSAGKVGANLAGGHGLGYDEEFICGNIVKCRWALSDAEFCREMLEQLHERTGDATYTRLANDSRRVAEAIRERIAQLRQRVWW